MSYVSASSACNWTFTNVAVGEVDGSLAGHAPR